MDLNELVHQVTRHEVEEAAAEAGLERATRAALGAGAFYVPPLRAIAEVFVRLCWVHDPST